jgi:transcriptional/translational regulatory protein YebC/TACO1
MFTSRGVIRLEDDAESKKPPVRAVTEEAVFEVAAELGADDVSSDDTGVSVACSPDTLGTIANGLTSAGFRVVSTKVEQIPDTMVPVADLELARTITGLLEDLEDYDDVQEVFANLELDEEVAAQL